MNVAIGICDHVVSNVFDFAAELLVADTDTGSQTRLNPWPVWHRRSVSNC